MCAERSGCRKRLAACGLIACLAGCDSGVPASLSPTSESDPERFEKATQATAAKARADQEAERKAFGGLGRTAPKP